MIRSSVWHGCRDRASHASRKHFSAVSVDTAVGTVVLSAQHSSEGPAYRFERPMAVQPKRRAVGVRLLGIEASVRNGGLCGTLDFTLELFDIEGYHNISYEMDQ